MKSNSTQLNKQINFLVYSTRTEDIKVNAILKDETIWLSQKEMAELFECSTDNIGLHLKNIFESRELVKESITEDFSVTATDGRILKSDVLTNQTRRTNKLWKMKSQISILRKVNFF